MANQRRYSGIVPPLVTPLRDRDHLDEEGLERLVEHLIAGGVNGLFILGTTGEAPSLGYRLRREFIERVCRLTKGRAPVLVGITDTAFVESLGVARAAADSGADAVVLSTPYYFPAGQTELLGYVRNLVPELPLPLMLYNMPSLTKVWFEWDTLRQLTDLPQIIGIKDSSGDIDYYARLQELRSLRPDWSLMIGPEHLMTRSVQMGGDGGVSGGANVFPKLFVEAFKAARDRDVGRLASLQSTIEQFQKVYDIGKYASRHIKATKCCLSLLGICDDFMAEPFHRFKEPERVRVRQILDDLQPLIAAV